jgi:hypothetical protein
LQRDRATWHKLPQHVAICFTPCQAKTWSLGIDWRLRRKPVDTAHRVQQLAVDVGQLAKWALTLGLARITVYDPQGASS